jgi:cyclopropane fatty-acyl-phospholipid synthase-like methyltransferase
VEYDAELRLLHEALRDAWDVRPADHVLDVGCGAGDRPVYYGPDVAAAFEWVSGFTCTRQRMERADPVARTRAQAGLRAMLAEHEHGDGVWLGSRAWIVGALAP